jgi:hypothetical protein
VGTTFTATADNTLNLVVLTLGASGYAPLDTTSVLCRVVNIGTGAIATGIATIAATTSNITIIKQAGDVNFITAEQYSIDAFTLTYAHM